MNIKTKKRKPKGLVVKLSLYLCLGLFLCILFSHPAHAEFKYPLLEQFPGFFNAGSTPTFPDLLSAVYKFGIWTVGIAAFFMLTVGGFLYATSAGNTASISSAKNIITDALWGLVMALVAYLLLYVINPDLVKLNLNLISVGLNTATTPGTVGGGSGIFPGGSGKCSPQTSGSCSIANMTAIFGSNASKASGICYAESRGISNIPSGVDVCKGNGRIDPVSFGLFQINISANKVAGLNCPKAFNRVYNGTVAKDKTLCWVTDRSLYEKCVAAAKDVNNNIATAKQLSRNGNYWGAWGANKNCRY